MTPRIKNSINNDKPTSGKKNGAFTSEMDLAKIKKLCKQLGCTHNDMMTTLLSNTLFEHFKINGENYKAVDVGVPFSMRAPSDKLKDIRLDNDMVGLSVRVELFEHFDEGLKHFKKFFNSLKKSLDPFGVKMMA